MIRDLIEELKVVDQNIWGLYTFNRDPLRSKVNDEEKAEMIEKANQCGCKEAIKLKERYGEGTCRQYAQRLGLTICEIEENNANDYILFAKFNSPNKISIITNNVKKGEETVQKENLDELIEEVKIDDILIGHEMFHFIEGQNSEIYTRNAKIMLWKIGPIKYNSGLIALGEIAAMAFVKELLKISYYPNLFDILLLYSHDEKRAKMLYDEVRVMKGYDINA